MNNEVLRHQVRCLIELITDYKATISTMAPEGWRKEYLRTLFKSVVNLQRAIRQIDTYQPFIRYLPAKLYDMTCKALAYNPLSDFRMSVIRYDNEVNDTFLFEE